MTLPRKLQTLITEALVIVKLFGRRLVPDSTLVKLTAARRRLLGIRDEYF